MDYVGDYQWMNKIIQFKQPQPKKKQTRKHAPRELSITKQFEELNEQWHKNEREFTDLFNEYVPHEKKYWKEAFRIYKAQNKLLKKIATKTELKREIKEDIAKYEKGYKKQTGAFLRFIDAIKKLD